MTSVNDVLYIDLKTGFELDIDDKENVSNILNIVSDNNYFYVIANKKHDIIGYYLFMIDINAPESDYEYLINWTNKTLIRQVDLNFMYDNDDDGEICKLLAVSYKAEEINTYNVFVINIQSKFVKFWFECY